MSGLKNADPLKPIRPAEACLGVDARLPSLSDYQSLHQVFVSGNYRGFQETQLDGITKVFAAREFPRGLTNTLAPLVRKGRGPRGYDESGFDETNDDPWGATAAWCILEQ